ncbi:MAG: metallophosphoesterase [Candidatus Gracilibacteria bacterium]|nr:metallophosphoesterase [Candidatus Gracilibacteria bacterium]
MQRTFFIGDVHGCYDELLELCEKIGLQDEDHLYFTGDIINKGPKSREVVEFVRNRPNTWSVIGNHEYFAFADAVDVDAMLHLESGHKTWIKNSLPKFSDLQIELAEHREWILSLPKIIETDDFILVHGGFHPDHGIDTPIEIATLIRLHEEKPWYDFYTGTKKIIYGHWAVDGLRIRKNTIGLDSGCVFGGHLTAYCLESEEYWQVHAHHIYKIPADWKGKIGYV